VLSGKNYRENTNSVKKTIESDTLVPGSVSIMLFLKYLQSSSFVKHVNYHLCLMRDRLYN
jgi:hypothetical protein